MFSLSLLVVIWIVFSLCLGGIGSTQRAQSALLDLLIVYGIQRKQRHRAINSQSIYQYSLSSFEKGAIICFSDVSSSSHEEHPGTRSWLRTRMFFNHKGHKTLFKKIKTRYKSYRRNPFLKEPLWSSCRLCEARFSEPLWEKPFVSLTSFVCQNQYVVRYWKTPFFKKPVAQQADI